VVTKREYLQQKGLAGKRGRFSQKAKEAVAAAINKGVKFEEPEVTTKSVTVHTTENGRKVVKTVRVNDVPQCPDPRPDRPEGDYIFENPDGSTFIRGAAAACNRCKYSMQWCYCESGPIVFCYPYAGDEYATLREIRAVTTSKEVPTKQPQRGGTRRGGGVRRGGTRRRRTT
jgi:hypothetical protein